ncbi:sugar ABC transporter substrate-binding protein [Agromyces sp. ISL-38]|uniref:ABC transporter substrate-binding protein n=1 Tax=Agromyces sp. ISL-38 TaxID=2819107 RepID=UPI001BEB287E|nr:sugar ABC transporter substrate-binding protein [Agromyces sp. ISL-38]MBT2498098.1 sugar ABC transporter substrate-binding protein [Agromyces sp. ISL-38]MBT2519351.1 sugar ABC transporter substrate-binding protein [Streptomyces sp. ISL-90]
MRTTPLTAIGLAGVAVLALTSCSAGGGGDDGPVTITYTNFISNGGNEENLQAIVDAFEAENPDITVDVTTLPYGDYGTALQTDLAAGTASDVFDIEYTNFAQYQANGVLAELEVDDPGVYRGSVLEAYQTDGAQFALPSSFSTVVLYFNRDLFDAAGLEYPSSDWTWAEEQAAAEALTDQAAGVWGDHQPVSFYEYYKVLAQNGGDFLDESGTNVAFNSPEGIEAAKWLVEKSGTVMPTIEEGQGTPDFDTNLFTEGKLAMLHSGIWVFGTVADVPFGWDIAVEPGNTEQASALFSNAVGVSADSEHIAEATKFAEFLTSSEIMVDTRLESGWELPAISDEAELSGYLELGDPENRQAVFDSLDGVALPPVVAEGQQEMQDIMTEELVEAQAGRKSVEDALASAEERINAAIGG